ncbi:MAG: 3,4-dihydroxy-2-butanone-4-phosphate synthase [Spirochaetales bacterium]|nr:3,4-dihydroxy-2-butanone-4-phosphate synthase [Spirochaetales bacterium]MCF7938929.1 3,4-dihydroxy-2-butanone-4-phosphate synthase [Spirochaetales bacterium]
MNKVGVFQRIEKALEALARGELIIVVDDFTRENEGDLVAIAEKAEPRTINFMATYGRGLICQPISAERADALRLPLMAPGESDNHHTAFTVSVDHADSSTGISAFERARTVKALADPNTGAADFIRPGHIFPLIAREGGVFSRRGHTEAAVDLARLAGFSPSGVICEIMKDDGTMARIPELERFAQKHHLQMISVDELLQYRDATGDAATTLHSRSSLPTDYGLFQISSYTSEDPAVREIVVLESEKKTSTPLIRIHSECATGEVFGSLRCDCGPQLKAALTRIGKEGGALVYLKQEGRGIGLTEKIRAYELQDQGADTVEANLALGHEADERRFGAAAALLREMGYKSVRLLTNNPQKEQALKNAGIQITEREGLIEGVCRENIRYLQTKAQKLGHMLEGVSI